MRLLLLIPLNPFLLRLDALVLAQCPINLDADTRVVLTLVSAYAGRFENVSFDSMGVQNEVQSYISVRLAW